MYNLLLPLVVVMAVTLAMKLFGLPGRGDGQEERGWIRLSNGALMWVFCVQGLFGTVLTGIAIWACAYQLLGFGVLLRLENLDGTDSKVWEFLALAALTPLFVFSAGVAAYCAFTDFRYSPSGIRVRFLGRRTDIAWDQISIINRHLLLGPAIFYGAGKCQFVIPLWLGYDDFLAYARSRGIEVDVELKRAAHS